MREAKYEINTQGRLSLTAVFVSDIHEITPTRLLSAVKKAAPDVILIGGDLIEAKTVRRAQKKTEPENAYKFLRSAAAIAPVYYALGNHETYLSSEKKQKARQTGASLLENDCITVKIGTDVLTVGAVGPTTDADFIARFDKITSYKILICHEPERAVGELSEVSADLVLSGHAHGGQWRIFGRGVYAPGQGLFPKYTRGEYPRASGGRLIVSAGAANHVLVPRFFNPTEIVTLCFK